MIATILLLVVGLALLVGGAEGLVRGASALARRLGVPPIVIGLTVVAFGTSTPELAVNVSAALSGSTGLSFGNVVGSNIANIGLIVGIAAMVRPLTVHATVISREIPMMLLATTATMAMAYDRQLDGLANDWFGRSEGLVLLLLFGIFLYYTIAGAIRQRNANSDNDDPFIQELGDEVEAQFPVGLPMSILLTFGGLGAIVLGGNLSVDNAVLIAQRVGVSDAVIGLTVIAVGTSLPELVTSVIAVRRGHSDIAIGNVVGSNIYNLLFVLSTTSIIRPVEVPRGGHADLAVMAAFSLALLPLSLHRKRTIGRPGGAALLAAYVAYIMWRAMERGI